MGLANQLESYTPTTLVAGLFICWITYLVALAIYRLYISPLAKFPGPKLAASFTLTKLWYQWTGTNVRWITSLHHEYGPIVRVAPNELSFIDAQAFQDIYGFKPPGKPRNDKDPKFYDFASLEDKNIINANDADHSRIRRVFSHAFSDKALREQQPLLMKYIDLMGEKMEEIINADPDAKIDMVKMLNFTTFDIMGDLTFGEPLYMLQNSEYVPWVSTILDSIKGAAMLVVINSLPVVSTFVNFLVGGLITRARRRHLKYSADRVDRRLASQTTRPDIWTQVLRREGDQALSLVEMHANADLFMIAGTETTATLVSGLLYFLLVNPEKMKKLQDEIQTAFKEREDINMVHLAQLEYLNACIEEALRMYPPVPTGLPRLTPPGGTAVCGQWIPANVAVYVTSYAAYYSHTNFRDPDDFIPERWISSEYDSDQKSALQPFSVGPRNCVGKNLAYHEIRLLVATILHRFDMSICEESKAWTDQKSYTLWIKPPLVVTLAASDHRTAVSQSER